MLMRVLWLFMVAVVLTACNTTQELIPTVISSTDTNDSAPSAYKDVNLIPAAIPQPVKRTRAGNKSPYTVLGKTYTLLADSKGYQERGYASWYGTKFHGRRTANGEVYDMWAMTAAHKTLPIPSYVRVTNTENGRSLIVKVNDRGPFHGNRIIDLSYGAAVKLGFAKKGVAQVDVVDVTPSGTEFVITAPPSTKATAVPSKQAPRVLIKSAGALEPVTQPSITPKVPAVGASTISKPSLTSSYYQVAAFQQEASANKLQAKLARALSVPVYVATNAQNTWYRVRVGPIVGTQAISETRQILSEQGIVKPQAIKGP